jgi:hypothetical protein
VHIFSQERQTRGEPRRLVRRVPSSAIPVLATDTLPSATASADGSHNCAYFS